MTAEEAWEELTEKFGRLERDGESPIYFWEPTASTPVSTNYTNKEYDEGWDFICSMDDLPLAYLVVKSPEAIGQIIVYAKWPRQGWSANPHVRHLVRHLIDELRGARS